MAQMGVTALAAHQIAVNLAAMTFMVPLGISIAITSKIGLEIGKKNLQYARYLGFLGVITCGSFMMIPSFIYLFYSELIMCIYTNNDDLIEIGSKLIILASIFQISDGLQVGALGALRGLKDVKVPLIFNIISYLFFGIFMAYFLGIYFNFGPEGLWVGIIFGLSVAAIFHNIRFNLLTKN